MMPMNINDAVKESGESLVGSIASDQPVRTGETKKGSPWNVWTVDLDDGGQGEYCTFGSRSNDEARDKVGESLEFYKNGGFVNIRKAQAGPASEATVASIAPVTESEPEERVEQSVWDRKDRESNRSIALSYAKDLAVADKITLQQIRETGEDFYDFITKEDEEEDKLENPF